MVLIFILFQILKPFVAAFPTLRSWTQFISNIGVSDYRVKFKIIKLGSVLVLTIVVEPEPSPLAFPASAGAETIHYSDSVPAKMSKIYELPVFVVFAISNARGHM